jgi:hypothetical protein
MPSLCKPTSAVASCAYHKHIFLGGTYHTRHPPNQRGVSGTRVISLPLSRWHHGTMRITHSEEAHARMSTPGGGYLQVTTTDAD